MCKEQGLEKPGPVSLSRLGRGTAPTWGVLDRFFDIQISRNRRGHSIAGGLPLLRVLGSGGRDQLFRMYFCYAGLSKRLEHRMYEDSPGENAQDILDPRN